MEAANSHLNGPGGEVLTAGPLEVRLDQRTVLADGRGLVLTVREFHLLAVLASRPERVVSREEIYDLVWGGKMPVHDRSVDVYVSKLRHKLEASIPHWSYIQTHIGFGYCFSPRSLAA
ncbi:MAG: winged helix-turn-helix transcriptional regulator [Solirubrobacterales bacterium]|nr:winged helix-turn-helix transcriptional regulator [Solirubrobacterales bacterium]